MPTKTQSESYNFLQKRRLKSPPVESLITVDINDISATAVISINTEVYSVKSSSFVTRQSYGFPTTWR